jgi:hypothetical protein
VRLFFGDRLHSLVFVPLISKLQSLRSIPEYASGAAALVPADGEATPPTTATSPFADVALEIFQLADIQAAYDAEDVRLAEMLDITMTSMNASEDTMVAEMAADMLSLSRPVEEEVEYVEADHSSAANLLAPALAEGGVAAPAEPLIRRQSNIVTVTPASDDSDSSENEACDDTEKVTGHIPIFPAPKPGTEARTAQKRAPAKARKGTSVKMNTTAVVKPAAAAAAAADADASVGMEGAEYLCPNCPYGNVKEDMKHATRKPRSSCQKCRKGKSYGGSSTAATAAATAAACAAAVSVEAAKTAEAKALLLVGGSDLRSSLQSQLWHGALILFQPCIEWSLVLLFDRTHVGDNTSCELHFLTYHPLSYGVSTLKVLHHMHPRSIVG